MHNKNLPSTSVEEYEEVLIRIEGTCPDEVLFYRDEGNVSVHTDLKLFMTSIKFFLDEYCRELICRRSRREMCYEIQKSCSRLK